MKRYLLFISMLTIVGMLIVNGQSELIISENFQSWDPTEDINDTVCSAGVVIEDFNIREMLLETSKGVEEIEVTLIKCGIAPECESRRVEDSGVQNAEGVTTGWVMLNKLPNTTISTLEETTDTIGEFIFGPIPQIDSIVIGHSATGANRGLRVYKSFDGIEWERATEDELWDLGDSQLGGLHTVVIDETNVYIKFTSGFRKADSTSQFSRIHNIDVWGVPGILASSKSVAKDDKLTVYPVPAKDFINVKLSADLAKSKLKIIDVAGKTVYSRVVNQQTSSIDISNLNSGIYFVQVTHNAKKYIKQFAVK